MGGVSRRFLNLVVDDRIRGARSLRRLDLTRLKLFNTPTPAVLPPPQGEAATIPAGGGINPKKKNKIPTIQLPDPIINFRSSAAATGSLVRWTLDCFPLAGGNKLLCTDQSGRAAHFDVDARRAETMPCGPCPYLHRRKSSPMSIFVPSAGEDDSDGGGGGVLYIMQNHPLQELGDAATGQFEAFVCRRPTSTSLATRSSSSSWHWQHQLLPPPPFCDPKYYVSHSDRPVIRSLAVVRGGSQVCVSVDSAGTYFLDTATHAWTQQVGEWTLPFLGKVEYVPELKMWFGICAGGDLRLGAADLSSMGMGMDSQQPPQLVDTWKELEAPQDWLDAVQVQAPQLVNLGSGRFCVARFFRAVNVLAYFGLEDADVEEYFTVLTGVDVVPCAHGGDGTANGATTCSDDVDGSSGKVELKIIRHNSVLHMSCGRDGTIDLVF